MEPLTLTVAAAVGLGALVWAVNLARNRPLTKTEIRHQITESQGVSRRRSSQ
jgi:hypothetical protein